MRNNKITKIASISLSVMGSVVLSSAVEATTFTKTTTFNPGFFWSDFTYTWTVAAMPLDMPYDDVDIALGNRTQINIGSYTGPGVATITPGPGNTGTLVISTINPAGFPATIGFSYNSVTNPTFVEGRQQVNLTLKGVPITGTQTVVSAGTPMDGGFNPGATIVAFEPGMFEPFANVDLFQNGHSSIQIGFGSAAANGSALISLNEPLNRNLLLIGENGKIVAEKVAVPEPTSTLSFLALGTLGAASTLKRKLKPSQSTEKETTKVG